MRNWEPGQISFGAFPRSGNHTLGVTLSFAFPDRNVFWLMHRITELATAPNCAVVVRNPLESISSWISCNHDERPDAPTRLMDWYLRYMSGVLNYQDNLIVFSLEDLDKAPYECAVLFANRFNLETPNKVSNQEIHDWLTENKPEHIPNKNSHNKKQWFQILQNNKLYENAVSLYNEVLLIKAQNL